MTRSELYAKHNTVISNIACPGILITFQLFTAVNLNIAKMNLMLI